MSQELFVPIAGCSSGVAIAMIVAWILQLRENIRMRRAILTIHLQVTLAPSDKTTLLCETLPLIRSQCERAIPDLKVKP